MENIIEVKHLVKKFGDFTAVDDISFNVKKGRNFRILGPNGAGKSTTIKMLTTILNPTSGDIKLNGHDASHRFQCGATLVRHRIPGSKPGRRTYRAGEHGSPRRTLWRAEQDSRRSASSNC